MTVPTTVLWIPASSRPQDPRLKLRTKVCLSPQAGSPPFEGAQHDAHSLGGPFDPTDYPCGAILFAQTSRVWRCGFVQVGFAGNHPLGKDPPLCSVAHPCS